MNIAYAIAKYIPANLTGSEVYIKYIAEEFVRNGNHVTILTSTERGSNRKPIMKVELINGSIVRRFTIINFEKIPMVNNIKVAHQEKNTLPSYAGHHLSQYFKDALFTLYTNPLAPLLSPELYQHVIKSCYDLVHITPFPCTHMWIVSKAARKANVPIVCTPAFHFDSPFIFNKNLQKLLKNMDAIFALTNLEKKESLLWT